MTALPSLGKTTLALLFERRHESPEMWAMARGAIRDARLWLRLFDCGPGEVEK